MDRKRFPRTRIVRDLMRLEEELRGWVAEFEARLGEPHLTRHREAYLAERLGDVHELSLRVHRAADFAAFIPPRSYETREFGLADRMLREAVEHARVS